MKTTMTAVLALSMMVASAFGAAKQDATTKTAPDTKMTTPKVKKSKKNVKSTSAVVKSAAKPVVASK